LKPRLAALAIFGATSLMQSAGAWADDYVSVRGAYYREASTRVIQPMVEVVRESPSGIDIGAHFLIDAITSASAAAGTTIDNVFTEIRDEAGIRVRKRWARSDATLSYKYSSESDYWAHGLGASFGTRLWEDTAALRLSLGASFDTLTNNGTNATGGTISCGPGVTATFCSLKAWFAGLSYSQILSPVAIAQISYEAAYLDGFQGNIYRTVPSFNNQPEYLPPQRLRNAISPRIAYYVPATSTGFQLNYRLYFDFYPGDYPFDQATKSDPWLLVAHTVEARVYQQLTDTLEVRLLFRYYRQNHANFWCAPPNRPTTLPATEFCAMGTNPPSGYLTGPDGAKYYTADPKLGEVDTQYPEIQFVWQAEAFRDIPFLQWFSAGSFMISYGYYFQNTSFGNAHLLQTGYRLPY
jgi:hypothetical protein